MNKRGFTLIELLAVIVILGVLLTLSTMGVMSIIKSSKTDVGKFTIKQIEDAAKTYAIDNKYSKTLFSKEDNKYSETLEGKDEIISALQPYFNEIEAKCSFGDKPSIQIEEIDYDYTITINAIECE